MGNTLFHVRSIGYHNKNYAKSAQNIGFVIKIAHMPYFSNQSERTMALHRGPLHAPLDNTTQNK